MNAERFNLLRSPWRAWAALLLLALAASCGGGGGVDTGGTGGAAASFSAGRVSGFGSVIVNAVHYDDSKAAIVDDDGVVHRPHDLRLGMTVQIEAGPIVQDADGTRVSVASKVSFGSEILGPVESVDTAGSTLRVLGQKVTVDVNTLLTGVASLAGIHVGDIVQVFAFFDPSSGGYTGTRIERLGLQAEYKLRGPIARLDTTAKTFAIGGATIAYGSIAAADLPGLQEGVIARVELQTQPQAGRWIALRIVTGLPGIPEATATEIEGYVTGFASLASFKVDGVMVDASGKVVFDKGNASQIANGARLEVAGHMSGGVLFAENIAVRHAAPAQNVPDTPEEKQQFELKGDIQSVSALAHAFVLRGTTVVFDTATTFDKGAPADLKVGATVQVKGTLSGGDQLHADRVKFYK